MDTPSRSSLSCAVALLALCISPAACRFTVDSQDRRLKDSYGRERYFRGLNVVYKSPPRHPELHVFDPTQSLTEADFQYFQDWGLNVMRLGIMWPGVEPERGRYNTTYLHTMVDLAKRAYSYGIYTLLDFHQDALSERFCGEGVPLWAARRMTDPVPFPIPVQRLPYELDDQGLPSREDCERRPWWAYMFSQAAASGYQALYDDQHGLLEALAGFWTEVARAFKGLPGVLGVELMNEPFAGDVLRRPWLLYPGQADLENLQPAYERLHRAIRDVDEDVLLFFESVTWSDEFGRNAFQSGFEHVPGSDGSRSVYSYHYYNRVNLGPLDDYLDARLRDAKRWGCGAMVTEFDVGNEEESEEKQLAVAGLLCHMGVHATDSMDKLEQRLQSFIGWEYKSLAAADNGTCTGCGTGPWHADGRANDMVIDTLTRTYAQAVAGRTLLSAFNTSTREYTLVYEMNGATEPVTIVYCNRQRHYPGGADVDVAATPGLQVAWGWWGEDNSHYLVVKHDEGARRLREPPGWTTPPSITVRIRPLDSVA